MPEVLWLVPLCPWKAEPPRIYNSTPEKPTVWHHRDGAAIYDKDRDGNRIARTGSVSLPATLEGYLARKAALLAVKPTKPRPRRAPSKKRPPFKEFFKRLRDTGFSPPSAEKQSVLQKKWDVLLRDMAGRCALCNRHCISVLCPTCERLFSVDPPRPRRRARHIRSDVSPDDEFDEEFEPEDLEYEIPPTPEVPDDRGPVVWATANTDNPRYNSSYAFVNGLPDGLRVLWRRLPKAERSAILHEWHYGSPRGDRRWKRPMPHEGYRHDCEFRRHVGSTWVAAVFRWGRHFKPISTCSHDHALSSLHPWQYCPICHGLPQPEVAP